MYRRPREARMSAASCASASAHPAAAAWPVTAATVGTRSASRSASSARSPPSMAPCRPGGAARAHARSNPLEKNFPSAASTSAPAPAEAATAERSAARRSGFRRCSPAPVMVMRCTRPRLSTVHMPLLLLSIADLGTTTQQP
uniref:Uncharacterized protein n=1 Tax=Zea mays TaxID=4577 RepID=B6UB41_MAIZE|nr:hypothetical protein [Zea mays]|eukprot:NP_001145293.1 uncharacterized protein LOC100278592 [Zea mays]